MDPAEQARFDTLLFAMTQAMKLHGLRDKTIDSYRRTLYRVAGHFGRCPDDLKPEELKEYFSAMLEQYSWSTIKVDLSSLQFIAAPEATLAAMGARMSLTGNVLSLICTSENRTTIPGSYSESRLKTPLFGPRKICSSSLMPIYPSVLLLVLFMATRWTVPFGKSL